MLASHQFVMVNSDILVIHAEKAVTLRQASKNLSFAALTGPQAQQTADYGTGSVKSVRIDVSIFDPVSHLIVKLPNQ